MTDQPILDRAAILAAQDRQLQRLHVPEWGGYVYLRPMSGAMRDALETAAADPGQATLLRARTAVGCICDQDGQPLFSIDDLAALAEKADAPLTRIFSAVYKEAAITDETAEEVEKNSEAGPAGKTGSF